MQLSADGTDRGVILDYLASGGFSPAEAEWSLGTIESQLVGKRHSFERSQNRRLALSAAQAVGAVMMFAPGVVAGAWLSVLFGVALGYLAYRRFSAVRAETFGEAVLTGRPPATTLGR